MREEEAAVASGTVIPVIAVSPGIVFQTQNTASLASVKEGESVTLAADGMGITATTSSGVAKILKKHGDAVGSDILVKFE